MKANTKKGEKSPKKAADVFQITTEKAEMEQLRALLVEKLKNKDTAQKAALIISEMLSKSA